MRLMNKSILLLLIVIIISISIYSVQGMVCYQESANVSNQTGIDGNCGLQYNGSYALIETGNSLLGTHILENITKPDIATAISKKAFRNSLGYFNLSIPQSCYNQGILQFDFRDFYDLGGVICGSDGYCSFLSCYNGSEWLIFNDTIMQSTSGTSYNPTSDPAELYYYTDGNWNTYTCGHEGNFQIASTCTGGSNPLGNYYESAMLWDACIENWVSNNTQCNLYNYTIQYYDSNMCNTTASLPIDNGTIVDCSCHSNYVRDIKPCVDGIKLISYTDLTNCGNLTIYPIPLNNGTLEECHNIDLQNINYSLEFIGIILAILILLFFFYNKNNDK